MDNGYVKLWRKSRQSNVFAHDGMWKLWCLCLMSANHKEAEVMISGLLQPVKIMPGEFLTGRDSLHYDYHQGGGNQSSEVDVVKIRPYKKDRAPSSRTLFRRLHNLESMEMLSIKSTTKYSIISITNWNDYQSDVHQDSGQCPSKNRQKTERLQEVSLDLQQDVSNRCPSKNDFFDQQFSGDIPNDINDNGTLTPTVCPSKKAENVHKQEEDNIYIYPSSLVVDHKEKRIECPQPGAEDAPPAPKDEPPNCPHDEIIALFHETLPELARVRIWSESRKTLLRSRWREDQTRQDLSWWRDFFRYVKTCDFLMGRSGKFQATLPWILKAENMAKVIEGNYER